MKEVVFFIRIRPRTVGAMVSKRMGVTMCDMFASPLFSTCLHLHIIIENTGSRHFSQGEVVDYIQERLVCLDCGEYLDEAEVLTAWHGDTQLSLLSVVDGDCFHSGD